MFIQARKLIGLPLAAVDAQAKVGQINQTIIDPDNGRVLGFLIKVGGILSPALALSIVDVRQWDPNGIVTNSIDNLVKIKDIIRISDIVNKKIDFLKMSAKTENGKSLGLVEDLLIDTDTECVIKYYLEDLFGKSRVLSSDKVIKVDKAIIFSDDVNEPDASAVGATV